MFPPVEGLVTKNGVLQMVTALVAVCLSRVSFPRNEYETGAVIARCVGE